MRERKFTARTAVNETIWTCDPRRLLLRRTIGGQQAVNYKKYLCSVCGLIYDEALGWPDDGIEPGTRWDDVPLNWRCPDCGAVKDDFDMVEI